MPTFTLEMKVHVPQEFVDEHLERQQTEDAPGQVSRMLRDVSEMIEDGHTALLDEFGIEWEIVQPEE